MIENDQRIWAMTNRKHPSMYQLQTTSGRFDAVEATTKKSASQYAKTYGDYGHESGMATKKRFKLIMQGLRNHIRQSAKDSKSIARSAIKQASAQVGIIASRKLYKLAKRIEEKALSIQSK
jgi:hypothetical protein